MTTASMDKPYRFEQSNNVLEVTLRPELNDVQWSEIESIGTSVLNELESTKNPVLVVDLGQLSYMGSAMVALIVRLWKAIKARNGKMAVNCPHEMVREVISLAGLDKVWTLTETREDAFKALGVKVPNFQANGDQQISSDESSRHPHAAQSGVAQQPLTAESHPGLANSSGMQSSPMHMQPSMATGQNTGGTNQNNATLALVILSVVGVAVGLLGAILLAMTTDPGQKNFMLGLTIGGAGMGFLVGLLSVVNSDGLYRNICLVSVVSSVILLIVGLLNKP